TAQSISSLPHSQGQNNRNKRSNNPSLPNDSSNSSSGNSDRNQSGANQRLSSVNVKHRLTPEERKRLIENGGCLYCRQLGHLVESCTKKTDRHKTDSIRLDAPPVRDTRHRSQTLHRFTLHGHDREF